jgi:hypothetical protein
LQNAGIASLNIIFMDKLGKTLLLLLAFLLIFGTNTHIGRIDQDESIMMEVL